MQKQNLLFELCHALRGLPSSSNVVCYLGILMKPLVCCLLHECTYSALLFSIFWGSVSFILCCLA